MSTLVKVAEVKVTGVLCTNLVLVRNISNKILVRPAGKTSVQRISSHLFFYFSLQLKTDPNQACAGGRAGMIQNPHAIIFQLILHIQPQLQGIDYIGSEPQEP